MKIHTDFIANSSSTSFLIITAGDFDKKNFLELMGVCPESPMVPLFEELYRHLQEGIRDHKARSHDKAEIANDWIEPIRQQFGDKVATRVLQADKEGQKVLIGKLSTDDGSQIEGFFAMESFEVENETMYFNALDCIY